MTGSAQAVYRVCTHLCVPAGAVLAGALAAALTRARGQEAGSAHRRALAAHVATLFCVQFVRTLYLFDVIPCPDAVPVQNYIELSAYCWLHTICINFALSFRSNHTAKDSYVNFLFGLAYAWCTPMILLVTLERHVEGKWLAFPDLLYDIKTCLFEEEPMPLNKRRDLSLQLAILRGITILITSSFFFYLSYKTGYQKKRALLCQEDADSIIDMNARQLQAMKYILTMMATGAMEVSLDVVAWYFAFRYSSSVLLSNNLTPSPTVASVPEEAARFLLAEWITLSVSLSLDFLRAMVVLELMWWGGPHGRDDAHSGTADEDSLPPYELATQMPRPLPASARALALALQPPPPPPSYASVFGERSRGRSSEDEATLLGSPSALPSTSTPPSLSSAPSTSASHTSSPSDSSLPVAVVSTPVKLTAPSV